MNDLLGDAAQQQLVTRQRLLAALGAERRADGLQAGGAGPGNGGAHGASSALTGW